MREYGFNLGLAFQIVDDVLDYTADASALGKPLGGDLREGKITLPVILLLQRTGADVEALVRGVVSGGAVSADDWGRIQELLTSHGTIEAAFERAVTYAEQAKALLGNAFAPSAERDGLIALADYVLNRDR